MSLIRSMCLYHFFFTPQREECSPQQSQIIQWSFPRLEKSQGSAQHIQSAMDKPRRGKTTFMILVSPLPGKDLIYFLKQGQASLKLRAFGKQQNLTRILFYFAYIIVTF